MTWPDVFLRRLTASGDASRRRVICYGLLVSFQSARDELSIDFGNADLEGCRSFLVDKFGIVSEDRTHL